MALTGKEISTAIHILALSSFTWSFHYISQHPLPVTQAYGGHSQYLTVWGLAISALSCAFGLLEDLYLAPIPLQKLHAYVSFTVGGLETLITLLYWSILWYDETLLRRRLTNSSKYLDLSLHLNPFVFLMLNIFLRRREAKLPSKISILSLSYVLIFSYGFWLEQCRLKNGLSPYPIMEQIEGGYKVVGYVLLGTIVGVLGCTLVQMRGSGIQERRK